MRLFFITVLVSIIVCSPQLRAKDNNDLVKANYCYEHMAFAEAIHYYEQAEGRSDNVWICAQLGDCYRLVNNPEQAAVWYDKAVNMEGCSDTVKLHYGQVLMQLMRYNEAEKWFSKYQMANIADTRTANLIIGCRISSEMVKKTTNDNVLFLDLNTDGSEFAPVLWKGKLVFTADTGVGIKKGKDNWTGHFYCNIYSVACQKNGQCNAPFNKIAVSKELNGRHHIGPCSFTADGNTMYFSRTSYEEGLKGKLSMKHGNGVASIEIMVASGYDETKRRFTSVEPFEYNSKDYSVAHPAISPDGTMLVFCSDMPGGKGGTDLYICNKTKDGRWSKPQNLGSGINTEGEELFPNFSDNSTLYFSSDGHPGFGGLDVYECLLDKSTRKFTAIRNMGAPFNSSCDDMSYAVSEEGVYFSSNRPAARKGDNIYFCKKEATKPSTIAMPAVAVDTTKAANNTVDKTSNNETASAVYKEEPAVVKNTIINSTASATKGKTAHNGTTANNINTSANAKPINNGHVAKNEKVADTKRLVHEVGIYKDLQVGKVFSIPGFFFGFNKSDIVTGSADKLNDVYELLKTNPGLKIQIQAYSDCRGTAAVNNRISLHRALAIRSFLEQKGIDHSRLRCKGYGTSSPRVLCDPCNSCTEPQHQMNRRIEFKVLDM